MVAITSSSSVLRYSIQRGSIPQVKRATEQTQQAADPLQAQAREAWRQVGNAEANARGIDARANQAIATAAQAKQDLVYFGAGTQASVPASKADASNSNLDTKTTVVAPTSSTSTTRTFPVVVNIQGQRIGTLINITA